MDHIPFDAAVIGGGEARIAAAGTLPIDMKSAEFFDPGVSVVAVLVPVFALLFVWAIGRKSPVLRSFGKPGRISFIANATLYAVALLLIVVFARY